MGTVRLIAVLAVAALAALAVWTWLPPASDTKAALGRAVAGYETASQVVWPAGAYGQTTLTTVQQQEMVTAVREALAGSASGDALTGFDAPGSVRAFLLSESSDPALKVTGWRGQTVYLKVLHRTLSGKLLVRAGVRLSHEVGTWDAQGHRLVDRRWIAATGVPVRQYTLGDYGTGWKVEAVQDWGRCNPDGSNVQEGPPQG